MDGVFDFHDVEALNNYINGDNGEYFSKNSCYDYNHDGVVDMNDSNKLNDLIDMVNNEDKELYSLDLPPINFDII